MKMQYERHAQARLFQSDWMEALSKVHPATPFVLYVPVVLAFLWHGLFRAGTTPLMLVGGFAGGWLVWIAMEYGLHRFFFHWEGIGPISRRVHEIIHGYHHQYPDDPDRLVMPISASIPLALVVFGILWLFHAPGVTEPIFAGIVSGYMFYDYTHWAVHNRAPKTAWGKAIRSHHMAHHFAVNDANYGISNRWIDDLMRSNKKARKAPASRDAEGASSQTPQVSP